MRRLLATEAEVLAMPSEQREWFMSKPGTSRLFHRGAGLKDVLHAQTVIVSLDSGGSPCENRHVGSSRLRVTGPVMNLRPAGPNAPLIEGRDHTSEKLQHSNGIQRIATQTKR